MASKPLIVAIGGTLRPGSSTEHALQICLDEAEKSGARTEFLRGIDLVMPSYNPEDSNRTPEAQRLVELVRECDGIILGSPGYHGSISGLVKNAIDYTEDLRADKRVYLDGRAVGCVSSGAGWQAIGSTLAALRSVVHALRGWPTPMGVGINTSTKVFDQDGRCLDASVEAQLRMVGQQVMRFTSQH